jgi:Fe-S cluster assembly protein SufD
MTASATSFAAPVCAPENLPLMAADEATDKQVREQALQKFLESGFPEKSNEEYKYSPAGKVFSGLLPEADAVSPDVRRVTGSTVARFSSKGIEVKSGEEFPAGVVVCSLSEAMAQKHPAALKYAGFLFKNIEDPLLALNLAGSSLGLFIFIPKGVVLHRPLQIIYPEAGANALAHARNLFVFSDASSCAIAEVWASSNDQIHGLTWSTEMILEGSANINVYKHQAGGDNAVLFDHTHAGVFGAGVLKTVTISTGGKWVRNNLAIELNHVGAEAHLNGLFNITEKQHVDHHTAVVHVVPNCNSFQLYKGVLQKQSTGVFNGKIQVRRDAQKTNAYQSSKNLVMSDLATMNAKPQLEIFADDVKCSHGSSTGKIDADALFYLRCRGISLESAKMLLLDAFSAEVIDTIEQQEIRAFASENIFHLTEQEA